MKKKTIIFLASIPPCALLLMCLVGGLWLWNADSELRKNSIESTATFLQLPPEYQHNPVYLLGGNGIFDAEKTVLFQVQPAQIPTIKAKFLAKEKCTVKPLLPGDLAKWKKEHYSIPEWWNPESDPGCVEITMVKQSQGEETVSIWILFSDKTGRIYFCEQ